MNGQENLHSTKQKQTMTKIFKYELDITDLQIIPMPFGAKCIHAGLDPRGIPCVWAEVNPTNTCVSTTVYVAGTGRPLPEDAKNHIGSFSQGQFMWHVYTE